MSKKKCVMKKKMMEYDEFMERIKKSFYYGNDWLEDNIELTSPLAEYASELFSKPQKGNSLQRLTKLSAGSVRVPNPCSLIVALIYLDRLNEVSPGYVRNRISPSDLFLVSVIVSSKFCYDVDEENAFYLDDFLEDCDMSLDRYKKLEMEFLCAIDWNVYISKQNFEEKLENIEKFLAKREGIRRGWLTYTELLHYLPSFTLAKFLLNNITVMAVSYIASVMTMAGAFFLVSNIPGNGLLQQNRIQIQKNYENMTKSLQNENKMESTVINNEDSVNDTKLAVNDSIILERINIEQELRKLEIKYKKEKQRVILHKLNNENVGPLISFYENYLIQQKLSPYMHVINFVKGISLNDITNNDVENDHIDVKDKQLIDEEKDSFENYTKSLFWNFLYDTEKSFKVPLTWFKFI